MKNPPHAAGAPVDGAPYLPFGPPSAPAPGYPPPASGYPSPAASPYGPPTGYGHPDPYAAGQGPAAPQGSGVRRAFVGLVMGVVALVVVVLLAYFGPRLLAGHTVAAADPTEVEVTLPTHLHGWTKMEGKAEIQMMKKAVDSLPAEIHPRGAVYGRAGVYQAVIIVETGKLSLFQQKAALQKDARELKAVKVTMRAAPAGPLGGLMQCGRSADGAQTICSFADDGMYGYVSLMGQPKDYLATVHAVRAAIEHRLG